MQIIVPSLVPLPLVPRAVAASATANQSATIAGPALGGLLYTAGPSVVYGVCLALFAAAVLLTAMIRIERMAPSREPLTLESLLRGLRLHPPQSGDLRRHLARSVRGAARRRDRAAAGVRARRVRGRPVGTRPVARRARGRRAHHGARADALADRAQRRKDDVRGGRGLRAVDHRVRTRPTCSRSRSRRSRCSARPTW